MEDNNQIIDLPEWPYVYGGPSGEGKIRVTSEDFNIILLLSPP